MLLLAVFFLVWNIGVGCVLFSATSAETITKIAATRGVGGDDPSFDECGRMSHTKLRPPGTTSYDNL